MKEKKFLFSIVMAVYNTDLYLREAINSVIRQTIGFKNIQLILVDDGSTDKSGKICDYYSKKYKNNIKVLHERNRGVSGARNRGLAFARGRYISFMDSDDKIDGDAFEKAYQFYKKHRGEIDVVSIPMKMFDGQIGDHPQNTKFEIGKEIVDLYKIPNVINMSVASFIVKDAIGDIRFDEKLKYAEDSKFILSIILRKMKLGLLKDTTYWYRRRSRGEKSASQSFKLNKEWYFDTLKGFHFYLIEKAQKKWGYVPKFIQYQVMYDLQWRWKQNQFPKHAFTDTEKKQYIELLNTVTKYIDDDVIMEQKSLSDIYKTHILINKYDSVPELELTKRDDKYCDNTGKVINCGDAELRFSDVGVFNLSNTKSCFSFLTIGNEGSSVTIEGYHELCCPEDVNVIPVLIVNNIVYYGDIVNRKNNSSKSLDSIISRTFGYKITVLLGKGKSNIIPAMVIDNILVIISRINCGEYFPVCNVYDNAYALSHKKAVTLRGNVLSINDIPNRLTLMKREIDLLREIWKKNYLGGRKAIIGRLCYHFYKPFKRHKLWLISDRVNKADDNGESMFRYILKNKPENIDIVFALSKNSKDYPRLMKIGKCVDSMTLLHKLYYLLSDMLISSHAGMLFSGYNYAIRDLLWGKKFVFIPHGVTKEDVSNYLNRYSQNIDAFVTVSELEKNSIINGNYGYSDSQVWLTGHPRYDYLYHAEKNLVSILPTWRHYLFKEYQPETGLWDIAENFEEEEFFKFYNNLINSERLISSLAKYGYSLQFFPHPNVQRYIERFTKNPDVIFLPIETVYRDVLAESKLVITDYSAAVFDFSYLKKPIIYCQFDKEEFLSEHFTPGYFDYERDGFGEVTYDLESTIDMIIDYVKNDCKLKDKYRERIDKFFAFNDQNNCQRVYERIMELSDQD